MLRRMWIMTCCKIYIATILCGFEIMEALQLPKLKIPDFPEDIGTEFIEGFHTQYDALCINSRGFSRNIDMIRNSLEIKPGVKILDIGTRFGFYLFELAASRAECTGLDILSDPPLIVNAIAKENDLPVTAVQGDACDMPFPDSSFDGIFALSTFEHIWDKDAAIRECIRVLKPGGKLMICEGNPWYVMSFRRYFFMNYFSSRGKYGGLRWLFRRGEVIDHYREGWKGRDEDVHSMFWWMRYLRKFNELEPEIVATTYYYQWKNNLFRKKIFKILLPLFPFIGGIYLVVRKV